MKITVKNIHQQTFTVEIDASRKVKELKILLANNIPEYPANSQYVIYAGRIMHDEQVLGNYSFESSRFLVVMNRPPIQHQLNVAAVQNLAAPPQPTGQTRTMEEIPVRDNDAEDLRLADEASGGNERDYIITGTEKYIEVCRTLIDMGYKDQDVELAMSKAFNNPERAVEYLLQGSLQPKLPPTKQPTQPPEPSQTQSHSTSTPMQTGEPTSPPKTGSLDFLKSQPQFLQLRRVVRDNPHLLSAVLKKIEDTNPSLLKLITDNKDEFLQILNEDTLEPGRSLHTMPMPGVAATTSTEPEQTSRTPPQPQQQTARTTITVTTQEKEAIERLKALGFSEHLVLQAYFACDKNELQAADFLLSQDDDAETL